MSDHEVKEALQKSSHKPRSAEQAAPTTAEGPNSELIRLQRLVGNHALQRMLAGEQKPTGMIIQTKMTVGAADDPYEREADAVASQVMAKRDTIQRAEAGEEEELQMKRVDVVQRAEEEEELQMKRVDIVQRAEEEEELQMKRVDIVQRAEEEEELQMKRVDIVQRAEEEEELQMKRVDVVQRAEEEEELQMKRIQRQEDEQPVDMSGSFDVGSDVESRISAKSGSGQSIPDVNRDMFESSMGHDFSGVNVHTDSESDSLNKELGRSCLYHRQRYFLPARRV